MSPGESHDIRLRHRETGRVTPCCISTSPPGCYSPCENPSGGHGGMLFCKTPVWLWSVALLALWELAIICLGHVLLLYDFAPWRRLLIRDNQLALGAFVKVVIRCLALRKRGESQKEGNQSCTSVDAFHK